LEENSYNLRKYFACGPGLVFNFKCTEAFRRGWEENSSLDQTCNAKNISSVRIIQFDMKDGQAFEDVKGVYRELKSQYGSCTSSEDDIRSRVEAAKEKAAASYFDPQSSERPARVAPSRDRSAHVYSP